MMIILLTFFLFLIKSVQNLYKIGLVGSKQNRYGLTAQKLAKSLCALIVGITAADLIAH